MDTYIFEVNVITNQRVKGYRVNPIAPPPQWAGPFCRRCARRLRNFGRDPGSNCVSQFTDSVYKWP